MVVLAVAVERQVLLAQAVLETHLALPQAKGIMAGTVRHQIHFQPEAVVVHHKRELLALVLLAATVVMEQHLQFLVHL
jgi:hypothetical protein